MRCSSFCATKPPVCTAPALSCQSQSLSEQRDRWQQATLRQAEGTQSAPSTMAKPPFCSKAINDLQCASIARASSVRLKMDILFEICTNASNSLAFCLFIVSLSTLQETYNWDLNISGYQILYIMCHDKPVPVVCTRYLFRRDLLGACLADSSFSRRARTFNT